MDFTSKEARAFTRFVPMEPAPPVTSTVLRWKVSERSSMLLRRPVLALHPLDGSWDAFLGGDSWVVLQIPDRLRAVHRFGLRGEGLRVLVGDEGIVVAHDLQDEIRVGLDVPLPFWPARNVVYLTRNEVVHDVSESPAGVLDVVDDALVALVNDVGLVVESVIDKLRNETAVGSVVLAGTVTIHGADAHGLCSELPRGVQTHELPRPLRNRVVVELLNGNAVHDVLCHSAI